MLTMPGITDGSPAPFEAGCILAVLASEIHQLQQIILSLELGPKEGEVGHLGFTVMTQPSNLFKIGFCQDFKYVEQ